MAARWIPAAEALARAGGFATLLPHLIGNRLQAQADYFTSLPSGQEYRRKDGSRIISWEWWAERGPRHEGGSRFGFPDYDIDIEAHGVEFDADAMDELFPLPVPPEPVATEQVAPDPPPPPLKPTWRRGDGRRAKVWDEIILPYLAAKFERDGCFADRNAAIAAVKDCLKTHKKDLDRTSIARGVEDFCPSGWFAAQSRATAE